MAIGSAAAPALGRRDTLRFNLGQTAPQLVRGTFTPRPRAASFLARRLSDPQGIGLVTELRQRYQSDWLWLTMAGKRSLLVLDVEGIREILDGSPDPYGPPALKVRGMSHFQPGAVTISTGDDWRRRRAFNDEVLGGGTRIPPGAAGMLRAVGRAFDGVADGRGRTMTWTDMVAAFRSMTGEIVFGGEVDAEAVLSDLDLLMRRANRIVQKPDPEALARFQSAIRERVGAKAAGGLAAASCPHMDAGDSLPVVGQIPHWIFAMKGTLALNCAYATALIAANREAQQRVRDAVADADLSDPGTVDGLDYLEGCLREAMRLWPTTPLIVRAARRDTVLLGHPIAAGEQVIIHNGFNHRHPEAVDDPHAFRPERWTPGVEDYRFNALSNGPQACAGREIVYFVGKAVLARIFRAHEWTLTGPELRGGARVPHALDHTALALTGVPTAASD